MSTKWKHSGQGCVWWTRNLSGDDFPIYITKGEDKWYSKVGNGKMLGPFDTQTQAEKAAETRAVEIAKLIVEELTKEQNGDPQDLKK